MSEYNERAVLEWFGEWVERHKAPTKSEREMQLAEQLQLYHDEFTALMNAWANEPFFSEESDRLDAYMDIVRAKVMNLLPLVIKTLRGQDTPPAAPSNEE